MSRPSSHSDWIEHALEGRISPEELDRLKREVVSDPELRAEYVDRVWLHSTLRAGGEALLESLRETPLPEAAALKRWPAIVWAAAAAACVTLAASAVFFGKGTLYQRPVATLVQAENCRWAGSDLPTAVNSRLGVGTLSLVEGIATLKFKNGATVTIEAPSTLKIVDAMHCRLLEGSLTAEVPEPAHGFTVDTSDLHVVDLGTRFGLTAGALGNSQVHVFKGEVEVAAKAGGALKRLTEGKGMQIGSGNIPVGQELGRTQQAQLMQQSDGWTAIPTSFGRGRDAYARRGDPHGPTGAHPLIMVKHTELEASRRNERRAFLTFDISQIARANVSEAQLVLDPEPSGLGFSALVPDSRFAVYGVTEESLDDWQENGLLWNTAPACNDAGLDPAKTRKLAEFEIPRGGSGGVLTVRGEALAEFIRRDTNGLVTFILVRETGESDPSGLVHAFASREHPTARPPTLRVK